MMANDENRLSPPKEGKDDTRISTSAPHSRSNSWRNRQRIHSRRDKRITSSTRANSLSLPDCSDPCNSAVSSRHHHHSQRKLSMTSSKESCSPCSLCTVRSFKTTSKGIVESGSFCKSLSSNSLLSTGSLATRSTSDSRSASVDRQREDSVESTSDESEGTPAISISPSYYRTLVLGASGVGKSSLVQQFTRSESQNDDDDSKDTGCGRIVSVQLDSEESTMEFIDGSEWSDIECHRVDAYVIMYSVSEPESFTTAASLLNYLRQDLGTDRTIFLVANKTDLMRQRLVSSQGSKQFAYKNDSFFIETSIALNVNLDELLVGILCRIKHQLTPVQESEYSRLGQSLLKPSSAKSRTNDSLDRRPRSPNRALTAIGNFLKHACRRDSRRREITPLAQMV